MLIFPPLYHFDAYLIKSINNLIIVFVDHSNVPQCNQIAKAVQNSCAKSTEPPRSVIKNSPYSARQSSTLIYSSNKGQSKYFYFGKFDKFFGNWFRRKAELLIHKNVCLLVSVCVELYSRWVSSFFTKSYVCRIFRSRFFFTPVTSFVFVFRVYLKNTRRSFYKNVYLFNEVWFACLWHGRRCV